MLFNTFIHKQALKCAGTCHPSGPLLKKITTEVTGDMTNLLAETLYEFSFGNLNWRTLRNKMPSFYSNWWGRSYTVWKGKTLNLKPGGFSSLWRQAPSFHHSKMKILGENYGRSLKEQLMEAPKSILLRPQEVMIEVGPKLMDMSLRHCGPDYKGKGSGRYTLKTLCPWGENVTALKNRC